MAFTYRGTFFNAFCLLINMIQSLHYIAETNTKIEREWGPVFIRVHFGFQEEVVRSV